MNKGFTLIELMVVIMIIGILSAIIIPAFDRDKELEQAQEEIESVYKDTRTITHNYKHCFIVAVDDYGYEQEKLIIDCDELALRLSQ